MGLLDLPQQAYSGLLGYLNSTPTSPSPLAASRQQGLLSMQGNYDPNRSFAQNALDPQALQGAMNIGLGFSGGGLGTKITGYHGSPNTDLSLIQANPAARQFDNATSQLGAFFAPDWRGAQEYAGKNGEIYKANLDLQNPYDMSFKDFTYFQSPNKTALGDTLPGEQWQARGDQLRDEASQFRDTLASLGHDSVIIRHPRTGEPMEIASFTDIPILKKLLWGQ